MEGAEHRYGNGLSRGVVEAVDVTQHMRLHPLSCYHSELPRRVQYRAFYLLEGALDIPQGPLRLVFGPRSVGIEHNSRRSASYRAGVAAHLRRLHRPNICSHYRACRQLPPTSFPFPLLPPSGASARLQSPWGLWEPAVESGELL